MGEAVVTQIPKLSGPVLEHCKMRDPYMCIIARKCLRAESKESQCAKESKS